MTRPTKAEVRPPTRSSTTTPTGRTPSRPKTEASKKKRRKESLEALRMRMMIVQVSAALIELLMNKWITLKASNLARAMPSVASTPLSLSSASLCSDSHVNIDLSHSRQVITG